MKIDPRHTMTRFRSRIRDLLVAAIVTAAAPTLAFNGVEGREPFALLGPEVRDPELSGIGTPILDRPFRSLSGDLGSLHQTFGHKATVVVVRDPQCPVSRRYGPRVAKMARHWEGNGVRFVYLYLNAQIPESRLHQDADQLGAPGAYIGRGGFQIAEELGVESAGDVFVLDGKGHLQYRGAIDDQFGLGYTKEIATHKYLENAVEAVLADRPVEVPATTAPGCWIDADPEQDHPYETLPYSLDEGYTLDGARWAGFDRSV